MGGRVWVSRCCTPETSDGFPAALPRHLHCHSTPDEWQATGLRAPHRTSRTKPDFALSAGLRTQRRTSRTTPDFVHHTGLRAQRRTSRTTPDFAHNAGLRAQRRTSRTTQDFPHNAGLRAPHRKVAFTSFYFSVWLNFFIQNTNTGKGPCKGHALNDFAPRSRI